MRPRFLPLALLLALPLHAQLVPLGPEARADAADAGADRDPLHLDLSVAPDGSFLAAWTYAQAQGELACPEPGVIHGRRFDAAGAPLDPAPVVLAELGRVCVESLELGPAVNGRRAVVWTEAAGLDGRRTLVVGSLGGAGRIRRLRAWSMDPGLPTHAAFPLRSGRFLVVSSVFRKQLAFRGQLYDAAGRPLGLPFPIFSGRNLAGMADAEEAGGGLAVLWVGTPPGTAYPMLYARVLGMDGRRRGPAFQVSGREVGLGPPRLESGGSGFVALWSSYALDASGSFQPVVRGRSFEADGRARTGVMDLTPAGPPRPRFTDDLAVAPDGSFLAVWHALTGESLDDVGGELVDADGDPLQVGEPLGLDAAGIQRRAAVGTDGDGLWVTAWTGDGPEGTGIYVRLFARRP